MDAEKIRSVVSIALYAALGLCALYWISHTVVLTYRNHKNSTALVLTEPAVVFLKHPETALVNQGRASADVHFITFCTDSGNFVKVYMNARDYYGIAEGSRGILTWQGERFWKFEKEE